MAITFKTDKEIKVLREGGKRNSEILSVVAQVVTEGVSTSELNDIASRMIKNFGDTPAFLNYQPDGAVRPYPAALCVSVNDEIVHGIPNENPTILKNGDIVSLDLGLTHDGLITDSAITVPVGKISKEDKLLIKTTREALYSGISEAVAGNTLGDIGFAIQSEAKKQKLSVVDGLSGHGVGYKVHEDPFVPNFGQKGRGMELQVGMVIAIEPMLTFGSGKIFLAKDGYTIKTKDTAKSAHFEHTIAITSGKPIVLTEG